MIFGEVIMVKFEVKCVEDSHEEVERIFKENYLNPKRTVYTPKVRGRVVSDQFIYEDMTTLDDYEKLKQDFANSKKCNVWLTRRA